MSYELIVIILVALGLGIEGAYRLLKALKENAAIMNSQPPEDDILAVGCCKGREVYIWLYREDTAREAMRVMGQWAMDEQLSFTWWDAMQCSQRVKEEVGADGPEDTVRRR